MDDYGWITYEYDEEEIEGFMNRRFMFQIFEVIGLWLLFSLMIS